MEFNLLTFLLVFFIQWLWSGLGITLCYHRSLTHRAFTMPKWLEYFFVWGAYLAFQGSPIEWAGSHRIHHRYADTAKDAHSPVVYGFRQSFIGWIYKTQLYMTPSDVRKAVPWLAKDRLYRWMGEGVLNSRPYQMFSFVLGFSIILAFFFGIYVGVASLLARVVVFFSPLLLNSICHMEQFGYRNFETPDKSQNVWWVALLTMGEGWHNSHHARPSRCSHQVKWWEIDMTHYFVLLLKRFGLIKNLVD